MAGTIVHGTESAATRRSCFRLPALQDIHDAANDEMVMKNERLYTIDELIGPYANGDLNT